MLFSLRIPSTVQISASESYFMFSALRTANEHIRIRTYKIVRSSTWPHMLEVSFPKSTVMHVRDLPFRPPILATRDQVEKSNVGMSDPQDFVRIFVPSELAKIYVECYKFNSFLYDNPQ